MRRQLAIPNNLLPRSYVLLASNFSLVGHDGLEPTLKHGHLLRTLPFTLLLQVKQSVADESLVAKYRTIPKDSAVC